MTDPTPEPPIERTFDDVRRGMFERRRAKVRAEIERNRRGEYWLPTWALVVILLVIVAACASLAIFA